MTDADKTRELVARLFGGKDPDTCANCGPCMDAEHVPPRFNPFTRIEDAFACVEKIKAASPAFSFNLENLSYGGWLCQIHRDEKEPASPHCGEHDTPARAIAESCYQTLSERW